LCLFSKKSWFNNIEEEVEKEKIGNVTRLDVKVIGQYLFETKGKTTKLFYSGNQFIVSSCVCGFKTLLCSLDEEF